MSRRLVASGHQVTATARRAPAYPISGIDFVAADIQDAASVRKAMAGHDAVVHLAWVVAPLKSESDTAAVNLGGTQNVLDAMNSTGCSRLVFSSSVLAYGAVPGHPPLLREDDERRPESAHFYAAHKKAAEDMILAAAPESVLVRSGIIAGRDVDNLIFRFFSGPALPVPDPQRAQQFVHTDDVARFTADAVSAEGSGPVNVAGEGSLTMREIADVMGQTVLPVPETALRKGIAAAWKFQLAELAPAELGALLYMPVVDTTRLREEWGFSCAWSSRDALFDMARAAHGLKTFGKKTVTLPWRVAMHSDPRRSRLSAITLRRTYAGEVDRAIADLTDTLSRHPGADPYRRAAHQALVSDLIDYLELLADVGQLQGYSPTVRICATEAAQQARATL
ncbi:UDP-glucose 4-epimerase GalE4 [Mycolicibacter sinensis]|uniref:UDP-glucose 4-epimerase GalE4 n=1 Tax=Mycolicibacter sinensis (strain JDM601) TaxID=875328 RepID=F5YRP6_MYCSD|nr:UDP-glucose 4-epimerase GalE4 [Mycolicibacter sinensis]